MNEAMTVASVLLVDDRATNLLVLETILQSLGANMVRANSGEEALQRLAEQDFAVVLLDVMMPTLSGFETARQMRRIPGAARTPIIFLTAGHDAGYSEEEAYSLGAVDFMTKPLSPVILRAKTAIFVDLYRKTRELAEVEQERTTAALLAKDERLRLILDNTIDYAFVLANAQGQIVEWEGGAAAVTGWTPDEVLGQHIELIFTPEDRLAGAPASEMEAARVRGRSPDRRWHLRRDGGRFFADGVLVGLRDPAGELHGYAKIFRDATVEHSRAEELAETQARATSAANELRELAARLSDANRRKTEFLAVLAHELRNPLAPLRNCLQLLRMHHADLGVAVRARDMMDRQLSHLVMLVDDLLDVARITQGKLDLKREQMDLVKVVDEAVHIHRVSDRGTHLLTVDLLPAPLYVYADATRLSQILNNLLNNASKYTPVNGKIDVSLRAKGDEAVIVVSDTGVGIPASFMTSIFDMFSQFASQRQSEQGGLGIGLALVRSLVELHGGTVSAASAGRDQGSTFTVRLPTILRSLLAEPVVPDNGAEAIKDAYRIMIVDDNVDAADSLGEMLRALGHSTRVTYDGFEALEIAAAYLPQLVVLDIGMPRMTGYEVALAMRQVPGLATTCIVALTGWGAEEDRAQSRRAGFNHHLTKPASPSAFTKLFDELSGR